MRRGLLENEDRKEMEKWEQNSVLAPNAPPRPAVTALAPAPVATEPAQKPVVEAAGDDPPPNRARSPARYLWVLLLALIYEAFPVTCPPCGAKMRIIAFIIEVVDVRAILEQSGEPATPTRSASARGPPQWYEDSAEDAIDNEGPIWGDPLAQPEPGVRVRSTVVLRERPAERLPDRLFPRARNSLLAFLPPPNQPSPTAPDRPISAARSA